MKMNSVRGQMITALEQGNTMLAETSVTWQSSSGDMTREGMKSLAQSFSALNEKIEGYLAFLRMVVDEYTNTEMQINKDVEGMGDSEPTLVAGSWSRGGNHLGDPYINSDSRFSGSSIGGDAS